MDGENLSIMEFSQLTGVSVSKLRYWDKVGLLSPISRNKKNNYRRYAETQLGTVNFITTLSSLGLSHKTIIELWTARNPKLVSAWLHKLDMCTMQEIDKLLKRCSFIHSWNEFIHMGMDVDAGGVQEVSLDDRRMNELPRNVYCNGENFTAPLSSLLSQAKLLGVNPHLPMGWLYDNIDSFKSSPDRPSHFLSIDPGGRKLRKAGRYLVGFVRGNYGELGDMPSKMIEYAKAHSLECFGPVYAMYVHTHICTDDPSQYLAKCSVAIK